MLTENFSCIFRYHLRKEISNFIRKKTDYKGFSPAIVVGLHTIFPKNIFTLGAYIERFSYRICNIKSNRSRRKFCAYSGFTADISEQIFPVVLFN